MTGIRMKFPLVPAPILAAVWLTLACGQAAAETSLRFYGGNSANDLDRVKIVDERSQLGLGNLQLGRRKPLTLCGCSERSARFDHDQADRE